VSVRIVRVVSSIEFLLGIENVVVCLLSCMVIW